ncbi:Ras family protein [Ancylostoma duodenale]|uniref:Ras family protein n=1 Tax=Ancylostoma duodenale TaxID=51022 RepID=A0A0C2H2U1_9BILA|nr:Ras family protein [Ancylostoma duodenale]
MYAEQSFNNRRGTTAVSSPQCAALWIVVVGDHNCGKSCILLRFAENTFRVDHVSTIGVDFKLKTIKLGRDKVRLELWDTAGMERYRTIYNSYYHSAHGVMCVYDMTNEKSFNSLENYWLKEIRQHAPVNSVLMLVGNKADWERSSSFWVQIHKK